MENNRLAQNPNLIRGSETILQAMDQLEKIPDRSQLTLFVLHPISGHLTGTITDGDIRRGLLRGCSLTDECQKIQTPSFKYIQQYSFDLHQINAIKELKIKLLPVLDEDYRIVKLFDLSKIKTVLPIDVVLMAGGRGQRLMPLTEYLPKPMIEIEGKPILEWNLLRLKNFGIDRVYISIKYLSDVIKSYFGNGSKLGMSIEYIEEDEPLGTAGCLALVNNWKFKDVLLLNSDILSTIDFESFFKSYTEDECSLSLGSVPYQVNVPYAILETANSKVLNYREKPTYTYHANSGIYLLKQKLVESISKNKYFDATHLLDYCINNGLNITHFPILNYWMDIGQLPDLEKARMDFKNLQYL